MSDLVGTIAQAAERLEISEAVVEELIRAGQLPHVRISPRRIVIPWRALELWLEEQARQSIRPTEPVLGLVAERSPPGK